MGVQRGVPPSDWPGMEMTSITRLTEDIYYGWMAGHTNPLFWHWCAALTDVPDELTVHGGWVAANTEGHTLVSRDPLHLEPSLLWRCCGLHGFVRAGAWTNA
ncbi:hypothetical protein ACIOWI_29845 [Streptomyces sp. NPDC087659]|uniref:hypothetical protein n=1 Tax=Streptomyces sp. NPDC087659 TaxID=3365801 RepID=UPI00381FF6CD